MPNNCQTKNIWHKNLLPLAYIKKKQYLRTLKVQIICTYSLPMDVLNTILPERLNSGDSKRLGVICYIPIDSK